MNANDTAFTIHWWNELLDDEERMIRYLQKLQVTELSGYIDNLAACARWAADPHQIAARRIFEATADDERRHSDMLVKILRDRGAPLHGEEGIMTPPSFYWDEMDKEVTSLSTCAAVFHLGERMAADRFTVLLGHPGTPADIRWFLEKALPDEDHHARIYRKLTTDEDLEMIHLRHDEVVAQMKANR